MRGVFGNVGAALHILVHHRGVMDESQMLHVNAEIAPVGREDVLAFFRQLERVENLLRAVRAAAQHVGIFRLQHLRVRIALRGRDVGDAVEHLLEQVEKLGHLLARAGDILFHLVDEIVDPGGHGHVHGAAVGILGDHTEAVLALMPVQLDTVGIEDPAGVAGIVRRAEVAELMQRGLDLKAAANEACGRAAGEIVLFDQQRLPPRQLTLQRRGHAGVACAHDHDVIFGHMYIPPLLFSFLAYRAGRGSSPPACVTSCCARRASPCRPRSRSADPRSRSSRWTGPARRAGRRRARPRP